VTGLVHKLGSEVYRESGIYDDSRDEAHTLYTPHEQGLMVYHGLSSSVQAGSDLPSLPVMDSGAAWHYFPVHHFFLDRVIPGTRTKYSAPIYNAGGRAMASMFRADVLCYDPAINHPVILRGAIFVEGLIRALVSLAALSAEGYILVFAGTKLTILTPESNRLCMTLDRRGIDQLTKLYEIPLVYSPLPNEQVALLAQTYTGKDPYVAWHHRLAPQRSQDPRPPS